MKRHLKISFFGSSLVSSYWNGAATYYRGIVQQLARRGHSVTFYEPDAFERQKHRDIDDPDWAQVVVYPADSVDEVNRLARKASHADVVIKASGVGVHDTLLEAAVLDNRTENSKIIFWDVDAPATLDRIAKDLEDPFRKLIPSYDLILTYGGGRPVVDAYASYGARRCVPIYNALDPDTHYPAPEKDVFRADLSFLGNRLPDREQRVEEFFLNSAALLPDRSFLLGGSGWQNKQMPANVRYLGHVRTRDHNAFNSSALAVLNISRESMARYGFSPATRVFEAAGAAACIITDAWEGIEQFLTPGREILVARDHREVVDHLANLTPATATIIGRAARRRVLAEHTYANRVAQLEEILFEETTLVPCY